MFNKEQFIEDIKAMTVLELADLVKALEEEFGVSAAALDGHGELAGFGLRPVIGRIVALHAHAEGAFRHGRGAGQQHKGRQNDRKNLFHDACSSLLVMKKAANGMRHCRFDPHDMETCE